MRAVESNCEELVMANNS